MTLAELNAASVEVAQIELSKCCGSRAWAHAVVAGRPYATLGLLFAAAERVWFALEPEDWKEAFAHHPRIGDISQLREKFASTAQWARDEQSGTKEASEATLRALKTGNEIYEKRFGHVFLICATGKSAEEMLTALQLRLANPPERELAIAAGEQAKILRLRLEKGFQA